MSGITFVHLSTCWAVNAVVRQGGESAKLRSRLSKYPIILLGASLLINCFYWIFFSLRLPYQGLWTMF